ncbi:MAG: glycosyltransferase family 2 protein [Brooklawnia sp.]|jgi:hypothetical protein
MSLIDVVVPAHDPDRPLTRAVGSALRNSEVRVSVVAHNCGSAAIAASLGELADDPRVRVLEFNDGIGSPAGPVNFGIQQATGPWISRLDSDDELFDGALDSWRAQATSYKAEIVLAQRVIDQKYHESLRRRAWRRHRLSLVGDGVFYATAPFGLMARAAIERSAAAMTVGLPTGEDLRFTLALYSQARGIELGARQAAYILHTDQAVRATTVARPLRELIGAAADAAASPQFTELQGSTKRAAATAITRVHVLARLSVAGVQQADDDELAMLAECIQNLGGTGLRRLGALSRHEFALCLAAAQGSRSDLIRECGQPIDRQDRWLTQQPSRLLGADAPLRWALSRTAMEKAPLER